MSVRVKVCGVTRLEDAEACVEAGVDIIGLNFWPGTPRCVGRDVAAAIVRRVGDAVAITGVFVDATETEVRAVREAVGFEMAQLHGEEPPALVRALGPNAYKALGVGTDAPDAIAARYPGPYILLDARVPGAMPGGTGKTFDWELAIALAEARPLILAGGLKASNVAEAARRVKPAVVDTASGVEMAPGIKDAAMIRAFVEAAKGG